MKPIHCSNNSKKRSCPRFLTQPLLFLPSPKHSCHLHETNANNYDAHWKCISVHFSDHLPCHNDCFQQTVFLYLNSDKRKDVSKSRLNKTKATSNHSWSQAFHSLCKQFLYAARQLRQPIPTLPTYLTAAHRGTDTEAPRAKNFEHSLPLFPHCSKEESAAVPCNALQLASRLMRKKRNYIWGQYGRRHKLCLRSNSAKQQPQGVVWNGRTLFE